IWMGLLAEPACRLVDEAELVIVDAYRADRAFAEVEDLVARRWPLAGDSRHLVVAVQMVLVRRVTELYAFQQLLGDVLITRGIEECGVPVQAGEDAVLHRIGRHMA